MAGKDANRIARLGKEYLVEHLSLKEHMEKYPSVGVDFIPDIWADTPGLVLAEKQPGGEELLGPLTVKHPGWGAFALVEEEPEDGYHEWQLCFHWWFDHFNNRFEWYIIGESINSGGSTAYHGIGVDIRPEEEWKDWDLSRTRDDILRSIGWVCQQQDFGVILGLPQTRNPSFRGIVTEIH